MKNWKRVLIGIVAIIALSFGFVGCDDGNGKDDPKDQSQIITLTFGTVTVKGHLTDTEWKGVADRIKNALNTAYGDDWDFLFDTVYGQEDGITIIVEKNPSYTNYSTTILGKTVRINYSILNNADGLVTALRNSAATIMGYDVPLED
jgi:hypothetical protein